MPAPRANKTHRNDLPGSIRNLRIEPRQPSSDDLIHRLQTGFGAGEYRSAGLQRKRLRHAETPVYS
jgi:hypothetical protein